jgi:hypothetical protein
VCVLAFDEFRDVLLMLPFVNTRAFFDHFRREVMFEHSEGEFTPPQVWIGERSILVTLGPAWRLFTYLGGAGAGGAW